MKLKWAWWKPSPRSTSQLATPPPTLSPVRTRRGTLVVVLRKIGESWRPSPRHRPASSARDLTTLPAELLALILHFVADEPGPVEEQLHRYRLAATCRTFADETASWPTSRSGLVVVGDGAHAALLAKAIKAGREAPASVRLYVGKDTRGSTKKFASLLDVCGRALKDVSVMGRGESADVDGRTDDSLGEPLRRALEKLSLTSFTVYAMSFPTRWLISAESVERFLLSWPNLGELVLHGLDITFTRNGLPPVERLPRGRLRHLSISPLSEAAYSLVRDIILASRSSLTSIDIHSSHLDTQHHFFSDFLLPALQPVAARLFRFSARSAETPELLRVVGKMVNLISLDIPIFEPDPWRTPTLQILRRLPLLYAVRLRVHARTIDFTAADLTEYLHQAHELGAFWLSALGPLGSFSPRTQWDGDDIAAVELAAREAGVDLFLP